MASKQSSALGKFVGTAIKAGINAAKSSTASSSTSGSRPAGSTGSTTAAGSGGTSVKWDNNTDYQAKINQAVAQGNYSAAAQYEQQRNAKIAATGSPYQQTNKYAQYLNGGSTTAAGNSGNPLLNGIVGLAGATALGTAANAAASAAQKKSSAASRYNNVDLGNTFNQAAIQGADADYLQSLADARLEKAQLNPELGKFYNDKTQLTMQAYINQLRQQEQYADQYNQYFENAIEQQQAAYDAAATAAAQQYRSLLPGINQSYDEAARQAYINNRLAQRDLPEQLAAAGIAGQGAAESSIVAQNNAYTTAYNQNELARQNALLNVDNQIASAYANASAQGAQSAADLLREQANAQQNILAQQVQMKQNAVQNLYNYAGLTGAVNGMPTLSAQELAANTAYNNAILQMQQQGMTQDAAGTQYSQMMDLANQYYTEYLNSGNAQAYEMYRQLLARAQGLAG